jgi:hypothetical protein
MPDTYNYNFKIPAFSGGINEFVEPHLIKQHESVKAQNCEISDGALKRSKGNTQFSTVQLTGGIKSLMQFYPNGVGQLILASGGKLYKLLNGVLTEIGTGYSSDSWDYVNFQIEDKDVLILSNGADNTKVYDGTSFRDLRNYGVLHDEEHNVIGYLDGNGTVHQTEGTVTTLAPKGKYIDLHYERIWMAGDSSNPNRVYFSAANDDGFFPDDWTYPVSEGEANQHGGFIEMPTWDGGNIIGLKVVFNDVLIFKTKTIFRIFGTYPGNYTKDQIFASEGAIADKSIASANNRCFFVAKEGIFVFDGTNVVKITDKICDTWETLNKNALDKSVGYYYKNKYIVAVPEGESTENNLIIEYDTVNDSFMLKRGRTINAFLDFDNKLLYTDSSGTIQEYNNGSTFNGQNILAYWETGTNDKGYPNATKSSQYLYFIGSGNGTVKFICTTERGSKEILVTLTSVEKPYKVKLKNKGRIIGIRIENVNGCDFNIVAPTLTLEMDFD